MSWGADLTGLPPDLRIKALEDRMQLMQDVLRIQEAEIAKQHRSIMYLRHVAAQKTLEMGPIVSLKNQNRMLYMANEVLRGQVRFLSNRLEECTCDEIRHLDPYMSIPELVNSPEEPSLLDIPASRV